MNLNVDSFVHVQRTIGLENSNISVICDLHTKFKLRKVIILNIINVKNMGTKVKFYFITDSTHTGI